MNSSIWYVAIKTIIIIWKLWLILQLSTKKYKIITLLAARELVNLLIPNQQSLYQLKNGSKKLGLSIKFVNTISS